MDQRLATLAEPEEDDDEEEEDDDDSSEGSDSGSVSPFDVPHLRYIDEDEEDDRWKRGGGRDRKGGTRSPGSSEEDYLPGSASRPFGASPILSKCPLCYGHYP